MVKIYATVHSSSKVKTELDFDRFMNAERERWLYRISASVVVCSIIQYWAQETTEEKNIVSFHLQPVWVSFSKNDQLDLNNSPPFFNTSDLLSCLFIKPELKALLSTIGSLETVLNISGSEWTLQEVIILTWMPDVSSILHKRTKFLAYHFLHFSEVLRDSNCATLSW